MGFRFFLLWGWPGFPKWLPHRQQPPNFFTNERQLATKGGWGTTTEYEQNDENLYASRSRKGLWWCLHFITRKAAERPPRYMYMHMYMYFTLENTRTMIAGMMIVRLAGSKSYTLSRTVLRGVGSRAWLRFR